MKFQRLLLTLACSALCFVSAGAQIVPFEMVNNSGYSDEQIYVALVGMQNGSAIWMDFSENDANGGGIKSISTQYNTLNKTAGDWGYADIFTPLSEIKDKIVYMPNITACRIFYSFGSTMYIHFFDTGGYAGADLQNASDPNAGIRWEIVEFSNASNGLWLNTTRVDAFQYPMGVELWGADGANNAYMKAGELLSYSQIIDRWKSTFASDADFLSCYREVITYDNLGGIIEQPSKLSSFKEGGSSQYYFQSYIDQVWEYFSSHTLVCDQGERGVWTGTISNGVLTMTSDFNGGTTAHIYSKPTTQDIIEGKGSLAEGDENDKALQAQFCGAMSRGVVYLIDSQTQYWGNESNFFVSTGYNTWNKYVQFFHNTDISYNGKTYAFAYDDTFDQSSTLVTSIPAKARITIGGFYEGGDTEKPDSGSSEETESGQSGSGTTGNLQYTYNFAYSAGTLTVSFTVSNPDDFTGLVPVLFDCTDGGYVEYIGSAGSVISNTYSYSAGKTVEFQAKWMYAGGEVFSDKISYTIPTASNVEQTEADVVSMYPVPARDVVYISGVSDTASYAVYDLSGKQQLSGSGNNFNVSGLDQGTYLVKINSAMYKLIVSR